MTIERSHGKARPTLPRASDLPALPPEQRPTGHRDAKGRFQPGNGVGLGRGAKAAIRRMLGSSVQLTDAASVAVARAAHTIFAAAIREMPHDGPTVRSLVAMRARHEALAAYWSARASEAGLGTPEGIAAEAHASRHGTRVERLAVTALDVAIRLAQAAQRKTDDLPPWFVPSDEVQK